MSRRAGRWLAGCLWPAVAVVVPYQLWRVWRRPPHDRLADLEVYLGAARARRS